MNHEPLTEAERNAIEWDLALDDMEAERLAAIRLHEDTPGLQARRRSLAHMDVEYWTRTRRAS